VAYIAGRVGEEVGKEKGVCDAIAGNQCGPRNSKEQVSIFQLK